MTIYQFKIKDTTFLLNQCTRNILKLSHIPVFEKDFEFSLPNGNVVHLEKGWNKGHLKSLQINYGEKDCRICYSGILYNDKTYKLVIISVESNEKLLNPPKSICCNNGTCKIDTCETCYNKPEQVDYPKYETVNNDNIREISSYIKFILLSREEDI